MAFYKSIVSWKRLTATGDSWEPFSIIFENVLGKVRGFLKNRRLNETVRRARASIDI